MNKSYLFLILLFLVGLGCNGDDSKTVKHIARDTTITADVAYTQLKLDSMSVEHFLQLNEQDEVDKEKIRNFYNARNYQYAWFDEQGLTEQGKAFWNIHQSNLDSTQETPSKGEPLHESMQKLLNGDSPRVSDSVLQKIELELTQHFFKYLAKAFAGKIEPEEMQWHIPRRKLDETALLDSFLNKPTPVLKPYSKWYYKLESELERYAAIAKAGGWPVVELKKNMVLKPGSAGPVVKEIKMRLQASGNYAQGDTSVDFNDNLLQAVRNVQRSFGLEPTGNINKALTDQLNVPVGDRIKQMKVNLERMRWMPQMPDTMLLANIPEFRLHVVENNKPVLNMNVVVGEDVHQTVIFSDQLKWVVFSPYWNLPESIVRREILPAMNRNSNYLAQHNMEIVGNSNGVPTIRQKPGPSNALGKVKFIFPNRYNIYFHDTPSKGLFNRQQRAFSHGCIRLEKPFELAKYLLRGDSTWTDTKIRQAMNESTEQWVTLPAPVAVFIVYFTAWVDDNGLLNFRDDIYGHDKRMEEHLFN